MTDDKLPGALSAARTPSEKAPENDKAPAKPKATIRDDHGEELDELTEEERRANREAYLRAWPLDEDIEKR